MKLIGIAMILIASGFLGIILSENQLSVLKEIERTDKLIKNIIFGIKSEKKTVSEVLNASCSDFDKETVIFLSTVTPWNNDNLIKNATSTGFCSNKNTLSVLIDVFSVLGRYSASQQIDELQICRERLKNLFSEIQKPITEKAKLIKYSCFLSGAFLVTILF